MNIQNSRGRVEFKKEHLFVNGIIFHCRSRLSLNFFEGERYGHLDAISEYPVGRQLFLELASVLAASEISLNLEIGKINSSLHTFARTGKWIAIYFDEEIDCGVKCEISEYSRARRAFQEDSDGFVRIPLEVHA